MSTGNIELRGDNIITYVCSVNDKLKICQPTYYPPVEIDRDKYSETQALGGFFIVYPELGKFEGFVEGSNMCVYYRHLRAGKQIIQYVSRSLGEYIFYIVLDGIIVHDHSSIPQGGPAYATYYSRIPQEEEEEF